MSYRSLRDFLARLESKVSWCACANRFDVLEMTESRRAFSRARTGGDFRAAIKADGSRSTSGAGQFVRDSETRRHGVTLGGIERTDAKALARCRRIAGDTAPAGAPPASRGFEMLRWRKPSCDEAKTSGGRAACQQIVLKGSDTICRGCRSKPAGRRTRR